MNLNYENNKNAFIHKESNGRFGFKVASEILRHDQHTAIPGRTIREIRFFGLRTLSFLAPSSASSGLKRVPYRRGVVTTISVLEFSKQHSPLLKYRIPQSIENLG